MKEYKGVDWDANDRIGKEPEDDFDIKKGWWKLLLFGVLFIGGTIFFVEVCLFPMIIAIGLVGMVLGWIF